MINRIYDQKDTKIILEQKKVTISREITTFSPNAPASKYPYSFEMSTGEKTNVKVVLCHKVLLEVNLDFLKCPLYCRNDVMSSITTLQELTLEKISAIILNTLFIPNNDYSDLIRDLSIIYHHSMSCVKQA